MAYQKMEKQVLVIATDDIGLLASMEGLAFFYKAMAE